MRALVRQVIVAEPMLEMLVRMMGSLTPGSPFATKSVNHYVRFGPGPRAAQSVMLTAKVFALRDGRINLSFDDMKRALAPAIRHRLVLSFQAEADKVTSDQIIAEVRDAK
jgi:MoxR-like ATPase